MQREEGVGDSFLAETRRVILVVIHHRMSHLDRSGDIRFVSHGYKTLPENARLMAWASISADPRLISPD